MAPPKTNSEPSTAVATIDKPGALDTKLPFFVGEGENFPVTLDEWLAMNDAQRTGTVALFQDEMQETTEGAPPSFPRWKFPTSGATRFVMDTDSGEAPEEKELVGIIVAKLPGRAYYEPGKMAAKGTLPLCTSSDGVVPDISPSPVGNKARTCAECAFSQWGTAKDGQGNPSRGQACKYRIRTFFLRRPEEGADLLPLPEVINLPPTAIRPLGQYITTLLQMRVPLIGVESILSLDTHKRNASGTEYTGLVLRPGRRLKLDEMRTARGMADRFDVAMRKQGITVEDAQDMAGDQVDPNVIEGQAERVY